MRSPCPRSPEAGAPTHPMDNIAEHRIARTLPGYQSLALHRLRTQPYYGRLKSLLASPEVKSVAAAGDSDFKINRLIFSEQRRRADAQGCIPRKALLVSMSSDGVAYADEWGAAAHCFQEGIGDAELFIEYDRHGSRKRCSRGPAVATPCSSATAMRARSRATQGRSGKAGFFTAGPPPTNLPEGCSRPDERDKIFLTPHQMKAMTQPKPLSTFKDQLLQSEDILNAYHAVEKKVDSDTV